MGERGLTAVVVGATGLVGSRLVALLLVHPRFSSIVTLGRRATGAANPRLRERVVDFDAPEGWADLVRGDVLFSALGTTLRTAGSREAQRRVDHGYQLAAARAARANGVPSLVLVSSAGASPSSRVFYSRLKGEIERDCEALGFPRTRILRPGLLDGERAEARPAERWALRLLRPLAPLLPAAARPIRAVSVGRAAIAAALYPADGTVRLGPPDLFRLAGLEPPAGG